MNIETNHKIATLMSAIAGVPDQRFQYAGYSDEQMVVELVRLVPQPALLGRYAVDLDRVYGKKKDFLAKLDLAVKVIPNGYQYLEVCPSYAWRCRHYS